MIVNSGEIRDLVTFQKRSAIDDDAGNLVSGPFANVFTVPARIAAARGREEVLAQRLQGVRPVEITVRLSHQTEQIAPEWRAINARKPTDIFNIHDIRDPDGKRRWQILTCTLGAPT